MGGFSHILAFLLGLLLVFPYWAHTVESPDSAAPETRQDSVPQEALFSEKGRGISGGNLQNGGRIALSGTWIYYALDQSLFRVRTDGGERETLATESGGFYNINVLDGWVYYRTFSGNVYRMRTDGTAKTLLIQGRKDSLLDLDTLKEVNNVQGVCEFIVIEGWIYYNAQITVGQDAQRASVLYRMRLDGSGKEQLAGGPGELLWLMDLGGEWIYLTSFSADSSRFRNLRLSATGGGPREMPFLSYSSQIQLADGWIYFLDAAGGHAVCRIRPDGTEAKILSKELSCETMNVCDGWVYCVTRQDENATGSLVRFPAEGGAPEVLKADYTGKCSLAGEWAVLDDGLYRLVQGTDGKGTLERQNG